MTMLATPNPDELNSLIGRRIRQARQETGMNAATLGDRLDPPVSYQQIHKYESGQNRISAVSLAQAAKALGRPLRWFLSEDAAEDALANKEAFVRHWNDMAAISHKGAKERGFWERGPGVAELIALMHKELSQALQAHREGNRKDDKLPWLSGLSVQLADCVNRILDIDAALSLGVAEALVEKMAFNEQRGRLHGKDY